MDDNEIISKYKAYEPIFGNWYIKRFIGEGGFAKVFEIVRNDFGREYTSALKIITVSKTKSEINTLKSEGMTDDDIRGYMYGIVDDTVGEIQLMYTMRGRGNIVGYEDHEVIEHKNGMGWDILIKMEYLTSLSTYIRQQKGRLAKRDIIKLGVDICKALEACQRYNIIHRDIKADNIFISEDGEFKLGDFGIARVIERKDQTLSKKGTSAYMAPEVYKGQTYTSAVDIYSLGMVMYRLMNNNRGPFLPPYPQPMSLDDRDHAMMLRMSGEKFPKPSQVTRGRLVEIVLKACAYRPEERYSSPVDMRQELEAIYLDADEMTTDEWVMIYDAKGRSTAATSSTGQSGIPEPKSPEPTGAAEALNGDATEVLREEDATEVLQEEPGSASAQKMLSWATKPCIMCGNAINYDSVFCSYCGASQVEELEQLKEPEPQKEEEPEGSELLKEAEGPKDSEQRKDTEQPKSKRSDELKETQEARVPRKSKKTLFIGCTCAAALLLAVIIGVASSYLSKSWSDNVLMTGTVILGSDISKEQIRTITFLKTLKNMPDNAWDVSADQSGRVKAWVKTRDDGYYDLYIGGEGGVTANENSSSLFAWYTLVEQIQFNGNFHTENVTDMHGMFYLCKNLTSVDVRGFDTSNVTDMRNMFGECESLTSVNVRGFDTSNVTNMSCMFIGCESLTDVDVRRFDTANVTNMYGMFSGCESLASVDVSGFDVSNVWYMGNMFSGCSSLTSLDLGNFSSEQIGKMSIPGNVTVQR